MNIGNGIDNLSKLFPSAVATGSSASAPAGKFQSEGLGGDEAKLSVAGGQVAQSAAGSDVRMDKVSSIQNDIQSGSYNIPASAVAQKVLNSMLGSGR
jgi:flagellar biosynthesis anti-sigma factor FlgM